MPRTPRAASPPSLPKTETRWRVASSSLNAACISLAGIALWLLAGQAEDNRKAQQGISISQNEYGNDWPFTVPHGYLKCVGTGVVVFAAGGTKYALNGAAETGGYAPLEAIGKISDVPGAPRINVWPILMRGLDLCKGRSQPIKADNFDVGSR